jgi:hypothetical protein
LATSLAIVDIMVVAASNISAGISEIDNRCHSLPTCSPWWREVGHVAATVSCCCCQTINMTMWYCHCVRLLYACMLQAIANF